MFFKPGTFELSLRSSVPLEIAQFVSSSSLFYQFFKFIKKEKKKNIHVLTREAYEKRQITIDIKWKSASTLNLLETDRPHFF